ncbi:DUF3137 domain-containing protein [Mycoplasmopsis alligatoris]|uniref:Conserved domain protein n=1 Tax=Mycoplasmopsis alligatoris A21JP2 TaxID=747682 RepID=D4XX12_9BACT|nr:DUF3137 domain-containing protein [Mycoplasmopsis alligatoris]EFF41202.1 conserved domain protein [Mycoplasmopsis alligatoris A21JP2]
MCPFGDNARDLKFKKQIDTMELLILKKYKAKFSNYEVELNVGGERSTLDQYSFVVSINLDMLKNRKFNWSLLDGSNHLKLNKVKLENETFNKEFQLRSNDEIASRTVFTPYSMEKILELKDHINSTKILNGVQIYSINNDLIITGASGSGFMKIDYPFAWSQKRLINLIYSDIMFDLYTLYAAIGLVMVLPYLAE